jgi:hypothetical protein
MGIFILEGSVIKFEMIQDIGVVLNLRPDEKFKVFTTPIVVDGNTSIKVWNLENYFKPETLLAWYQTQARSTNLRAHVEMRDELDHHKYYYADRLEIAK